MNYIKDNPVGIDVIIQPMQIELYDKLSTSWGDIRGFGRIYKNKKKSRILPEHYLGNGEYMEVLTSDKFTATFFFVESGNIVSKGGCLSKTNVDLIFLVDVKKAKSSIAHYADEEIRLEVLSIAKKYFSSVEETVKGFGALEGFTTEGIDYIYPYFIFKITGIINNY